MADDIDALVERLRNPPFGTETSERNLFAAAADTIDALRAELEGYKGVADMNGRAVREQLARAEKAEAERDEALQLAEGPSTLRDLVAAFHERGARLVAGEARAERLAVLLAAVTEIAARNEDAECIREARRALEESDHG